MKNQLERLKIHLKQLKNQLNLFKLVFDPFKLIFELLLRDIWIFLRSQFFSQAQLSHYLLITIID